MVTELVPTNSQTPLVVFDLVSQPDVITPPWWFLAIFWTAGVVLVVLAYLSWRYKWRRWRSIHFTLFAVFWWGMVVYSTWNAISVAGEARRAAREGTFLTAKGCLTEFHPGLPTASKTTIADEYWTVAGERFRYGENRVGFAWKKVEPLGGVVHADSYVEVGFVRNAEDGGNDIIRLAVAPHRCPRAPDPGNP